ncbi:MAG: imidazolonepropionase, partial [Rhodothermales bacterium]
DCHTHLAFGGWREDEFEMRSLGRTYQDIARSGGGIMNTVRRTREATEDELFERSLGFIHEMLRLGVTTVECKSGYGLTTEEELKLLRVYRRLQARTRMEIVPTLLAAHTFPPESSRDEYVDLICEEIIPRSAGLAEFCDVFLEEGAFSGAEAERVLSAGMKYGLKAKIHADQLTDSGGAELAARVHAVSADHLEYASGEGIRSMAEAGVTAVNLPIATLYLQQKPFDARAFIGEGVAVAVASDFNPGSAPSYHLPLAMTLACIMTGMAPAEALKGATIYGARACGREHVVGSLEPGKRANFILIDAPSVNHWIYHFRGSAVTATYLNGERI